MSPTYWRGIESFYGIAFGIIGLLFTRTSAAPQFDANLHFVQFLENTRKGELLFVLTARDSNPQAVLTFSTNDAVTNEFVELIPLTTVGIATANVTLKNDLDREKNPGGIALMFSVTDTLNTVYKTVRLYILDVCDEKPQFEKPAYTLERNESSFNGSNLIVYTSIHATDRDNGNYAVITYEMQPNTESPYWWKKYNETFSINAQTGDLYLLRDLDYEENSFYQYKLFAHDTCNLNATPADLTIKVKDVQDMPPFFIGLPYVKNINEGDYSHESVLRVTAIDGDLGISNPVSYLFIPSDRFCQEHFAINASTGEVIVTGRLDWEMDEVKRIHGVCNFIVEAKEIDTHPENQRGQTVSNVTLTVIILKSNTQAPNIESHRTTAGNVQTALNATTAPLVLQRSDVECQTTSLKIFVPKNLVPGNGTVTWRDSACVVHSNGTHFVDSVGLRDCGTTLTLEADSVVFENDLILHKNGTQMQNGNSIVTYGSDYEFAIPVKCVYPRNSNISTSYIPIVQQVRIMERRNGQLDLTMRQYEAEDYRHPVPFNAYPRQVPLNNDIFIRLAMENNVTGLGLSADNCFATSTPSPVDQNWYQLISSGCPVNNAKIHPSGINDVKFSFHAFNFRHNTSGIVYVHCQVSVCLDTDPACVVGCMTRKKRSASAREGAITSNLISTGPFILAADEGGVAMSTVVAAVSIAAAVIATVVAIIGWTRKSKKGADS